MTPLRLLLIAAIARACPATPAATADDAFRTLVEKIGARTERRVIAWGTAQLADDGVARRFAVLEPEDLRHGRGAYVIEDKSDALWLVSFYADGRTVPWALETGATSDADAPWRTLDDRAIEHAQGHPGGGEQVTFALRDGELVVLEHDHIDDVEREVVERQRFAQRGVCREPCPALRGFATEDLDLRVVGPARTVDALLGAE